MSESIEDLVRPAVTAIVAGLLRIPKAQMCLEETISERLESIEAAIWALVKKLHEVS